MTNGGVLFRDQMDVKRQSKSAGRNYNQPDDELSVMIDSAESHLNRRLLKYRSGSRCRGFWRWPMRKRSEPD